MSDIAICVEKLSKQYKIGAAQHRHDTLRDAIVGFGSRISNVFRSLSNPKLNIQHPKSDTIWALKDVSLEVKQGEVLGIIGHNGAGKSTLLKILSRITKPTIGCATLYGRVASLLEVGTGFHPELTGRENIYLNGAVLGMSRAEISHKFDEIVDFSGVEKFIDTPVKRYSSGMSVRLAFSVAAHLEPEILLVDEVLAVGDAAFQKKCLGKMGDVVKEGRTVLFVSHNMAAVENLCGKAILLNAGSIVFQGNSRQVINYYLETALPSTVEGVLLAERKDRSGSGKIRLTSFHVEDVEGNRLAAVCSGMDVVFSFGFQCDESGGLPKNVDVGFGVNSSNDQRLFILYSSFVGQTFDIVSYTGVFRCYVSKFPLSSGCYLVGARVTVEGEEADWPWNGVGYLDVEAGDFYGTGSKGFNEPTYFMVNGRWEVQKV